MNPSTKAARSAPGARDARRSARAVNAEGADFSEIARKKSIEKEIKVKAGHADLPKEVDEKVSLLSDSEISDIIEIGKKYYIYKYIKNYDEDATADRKELIEKNQTAIKAVCR